MVVAKCDVRRFFAIESAVALCLVCVRACVSVEEIIIVHPNVSVSLLKPDVIAFARIDVHNAHIADFDILRIFNANAPTVHGRVFANAFDSNIRIRRIS